MPILFNQPREKKPFYKCLVPQSGKVYHVKIATDKSYHLETATHYLVATKRTVPCLHNDCKNCPQEIREVVYVPSLLFVVGGREFRPHILPVTLSWRDLLDQDLKKWVFELRRGEEKSTTVSWSIKEQIPEVAQEFVGFDIAPSLYRMWGIKDVQTG